MGVLGPGFGAPLLSMVSMAVIPVTLAVFAFLVIGLPVAVVVGRIAGQQHP